DPWPVRSYGVEERLVELTSLVGQRAEVHLDAVAPEAFGAAAGDRGGIRCRRNDASDARIDQRLHAWWRLPVMVTRLERHIRRCVSRTIACLPQRHDLGVVA